MANLTILRVESVSVDYNVRGMGLSFLGRSEYSRIVRAVDKISFEIGRGETFGLVGESGCGKSTLGRAILKLNPISSGRILFEGRDISMLRGKDLLEYRKKVQVVFQDPFASLDPRQRVIDSVVEPLMVHGFTKSESLEHATDMLELVGIKRDQFTLFPHQFSGGQKQRICIARALSLSPKLLILDEPTSSLDVSIQTQILQLLKNLQSRFDLTYLFISHNLLVVRMMSDMIASMFRGKLVEIGPCQRLFSNPLHPYTQRLLSAIPEAIPRRENNQSSADSYTTRIKSDQKSSRSDEQCKYYGLCPYGFENCDKIEPRLQMMGDFHSVACHLYPNNMSEEVKNSMNRVMLRKRISTGS